MPPPTHLHIGGVPEHFNLPWKLAIEDGLFAVKNIELYWHDYVGGTGDICKALKDKKLDLAVALTEGVVKEIAAGSEFELLQFYVNSPLCWGIHMGPQAAVTSISPHQKPFFAISRPGSGSHLMAFILAEQMGWPSESLHFETVQNFSGAQKCLYNYPEALFLWEKFMTKPYVDAGQLKRVGEIFTPWKSFILIARKDVAEIYTLHVTQICEIITTFCYKFKQNSSQSIYALAHNFDLSMTDAKEWFNMTEWNYEVGCDRDEIEKVKLKLKELKLI